MVVNGDDGLLWLWLLIVLWLFDNDDIGGMDDDSVGVVNKLYIPFIITDVNK